MAWYLFKEPAVFKDVNTELEIINIFYFCLSLQFYILSNSHLPIIVTYINYVPVFSCKQTSTNVEYSLRFVVKRVRIHEVLIFVAAEPVINLTLMAEVAQVILECPLMAKKNIC